MTTINSGDRISNWNCNCYPMTLVEEKILWVLILTHLPRARFKCIHKQIPAAAVYSGVGSLFWVTDLHIHSLPGHFHWIEWQLSNPKYIQVYTRTFHQNNSPLWHSLELHHSSSCQGSNLRGIRLLFSPGLQTNYPSPQWALNVLYPHRFLHSLFLVNAIIPADRI